jgi:hypothetical protein
MFLKTGPLERLARTMAQTTQSDPKKGLLESRFDQTSLGYNNPRNAYFLAQNAYLTGKSNASKKIFNGKR